MCQNEFSINFIACVKGDTPTANESNEMDVRWMSMASDVCVCFEEFSSFPFLDFSPVELAD